MAQTIFLALVALLVVSAQGAFPKSCGIMDTKTNKTASMAHMPSGEHSFTVDGAKMNVYTALCNASTWKINGTKCHGNIVILDKAGKCAVAFDEAESLERVGDSLIAKYRSTEDEMWATVNIKCNKSAGEFDAESSEFDKTDDTYIFNVQSMTVCEGYAPADKKKLSTGVVIAIVIGAVAVIAIIIGVCVFKSKSGGNDAQYSRV